MNIKIPHKKWVLAAAISTVLCLAAIAVFTVMRKNAEPAASSEDCVRVTEIASELRDISSKENAEYSPWLTAKPGTKIADTAKINPKKQIDRYLLISKKARIAAASIRTPELKKNLDKWADGFELFAQIQQAPHANSSRIDKRPEELEKIYKIGDLIYTTANELHEACPVGWPLQSDS